MSFPRYPQYKPSGVEWLGDVPEHWSTSRLGFESWVRARLGWKGLKAEEYVDEGIAFLSTPNIKGKEIDFVNVNYINEHRYEESPEIKLRTGDVLLAKDGSTLGTVNVVRSLPHPSTVNSSIAVITPNARLDSVFLYYLFESTYMENTIQRIKGGMGVPHLFQEDLNKFYLPIPSQPEQAAIAAFLDCETAKIDGLVAEQQRLIELLKEKRQAVISQAVTKGLNPNTRLKPSGIEWIGDVPEHWTCLQIGKVCNKVADGPHFSPNYVENGVLFLSARNVKVDSWSFDDVKYVSEKDCSDFDRRIIPQPGDVLYTKGGTTGIARVVDFTERFQVWVHIAVLKLIPECANSYYIAFVLNSTSCYEQSQLLTRGASNNDLGLTRMIKIWFALPPLEEQCQIVDHLRCILEKLDTLTAEAERAVDLLHERRTALISAAVTGKIDVRGENK